MQTNSTSGGQLWKARPPPEKPGGAEPAEWGPVSLGVVPPGRTSGPDDRNQPWGGQAEHVPTHASPYVLLRHVDNRPWGSGGSRESWLPHSILPWVSLEEKASDPHLCFLWGVNCSLAGTWEGSRCPRGVRRCLGAEHSGLESAPPPTPGRAGSEPGSPPQVSKAAWVGMGQRTAALVPPCTSQPVHQFPHPPTLTFSPRVPFSPFGPCGDRKEIVYHKQNMSPASWRPRASGTGLE